jgi:hypothetical protein
MGRVYEAENAASVEFALSGPESGEQDGEEREAHAGETRRDREQESVPHGAAARQGHDSEVADAVERLEATAFGAVGEVERGGGDGVVPRLVRQQPPADLDRLGQVDADPPHATVVDALEPGLEALAERDDGGARVRGEEAADLAVERAHAQRLPLGGDPVSPKRSANG